MPTRCELIAKAKEKGLKGYSKMKKAELQSLVEGGGGKAEAPKKTYAFKKKEAPKPAPLKASGTARRVKAKDTAKGKAGISLDNGDGGTITLNVGDKVELRNIKHNLNLKDGRSQEMKLGTGVGHANVMATVEGIDGNNVKFGFGDISNMIKQNQSGKETTPYSHRSINGKKTFTISRKQFDSSRKNMPKIANIISRGE